MSTKYKHGETVPADVLVARLRELSKAVTEGREAVLREFTMRVPAELDRDADLVLSSAADRIAELERWVEFVRMNSKDAAHMADVAFRDGEK